jgi:mercuric ion transport protein
MANNSLQNAARCYKGGLWGAIIAAVCCFTPILVVGLGFLGLASIIPYLDRVLLPLALICLLVGVYGWWRMKQCREESKE